ncbi:agamous-like MADS-box protein AGL80 [Cajanus cajan]|uniref:Agamous-like MADS-box protein AGL80 n=1 Tax=Cajanus cajan TaxID=3821 RepID=A0A151RPP1_CAJCA|nr:agamous-like MADS-box protein AGL80 [Cajanus cajan]KYP44516.1 Agamous-like MADS-box protein AGL80 [Cajanus cajan]
MPRSKVKLAFIVNNSTRRAAYRKRKKGMLKKIDELSTLCGIEACAIIYSSYDPEPVAWPSERGVHKVLGRLKNMSESDQNKKMVNQKSLITKKIQKCQEQLDKLVKENKKKEMTMFMIHCLNAGTVLPDSIKFDMNNSHGLDMVANAMQWQLFKDWLNDDDETVVPPSFGDAN